MREMNWFCSQCALWGFEISFLRAFACVCVKNHIIGYIIDIFGTPVQEFKKYRCVPM